MASSWKLRPVLKPVERATELKLRFLKATLALLIHRSRADSEVDAFALEVCWAPPKLCEQELR